jgi:hypothetical protein
MHTVFPKKLKTFHLASVRVPKIDRGDAQFWIGSVSKEEIINNIIHTHIKNFERKAKWHHNRLRNDSPSDKKCA